MQTADFHYELPGELIAQHPAARRDGSRLLVLDRARKTIAHEKFPALLDHLKSGDVLVLNDSRVIPARLRGVNTKSGGAFEMLLLEENSVNDWWAMMKPGKRATPGTNIHLLGKHAESQSIKATVTEFNSEGHRRLTFSGCENILDHLASLGEIPLPPYIRRTEPTGSSAPESAADSDGERYQTVFAQPPGSVAAPTAGLHFTPELLGKIREHGVEICFVTLHVGLGTFSPVKADSLADHIMHEERYEISPATATAVNTARREGRRIVAVGTTSVRVLESSASTPVNGSASSRISAGTGRTRIFIFPPRRFQIVDALLTNFHLPCSTLIMLVSAFAAPGEVSGRETILDAYSEAVRERYRFFSYGDAMLLL
jgi:S-adenosylmethionine:tRNA ribosyltransferase-isomerase